MKKMSPQTIDEYRAYVSALEAENDTLEQRNTSLAATNTTLAARNSELFNSVISSGGTKKPDAQAKKFERPLDRLKFDKDDK